MAGNDVIRGTLEADTLSGGSGDDVLIGRDGNDRLDGGTGQNSYLPGAGNDAVIGGSGLDIVFFAGPRANYDLNSGCTKTECEVTASGSSTTDGTDALAGVEIVIFTDARVDLPDP
jgi:Ca2+-binding RTX toxin-like protein